MVRRSAASLITSGQHSKRRLVDVTIRRIPRALAAYFGSKGLRLLLNTATAVLVLMLPYTAATSARVEASLADAAAPSFAAVPMDDLARAQIAARGVIAGTRSPTTVAAPESRPVVIRTIAKDDTLSTMANYYDLSLEAVAYANDISEEDQTLSIGHELLIPPGEGALYKVKDGDTPENVADRFKVDPAVIMSGWPVKGVITQYFWWGHTGVDIAAPYGTGIGASDDGIVVATGPVAVGGLRVCVQHSGGLQTCYYHTSAVYVSPGQTVARGQLIAAIGLTGVTTGPHVHWELKVNGVAQDPLAY